MEDFKEDDFEETKIDIKLEGPDIHDMVVHDAFDTSEDSIVGAIKQEESIDSESEKNMSNNDTTIINPTVLLKMEYSDDNIFEETKNDILEEIKPEDTDMSDYIDIKEEKLIIKSEFEDPVEDNTNREERNLSVKSSLRSASRPKDDSTFVTNINFSKKEPDPDLESPKKQLRHRSETKKETFGCSKCNYQTKVKGDLTNHMRRHKIVTEIDMLSCDECNFQTKHKRTLDRHKLRHKSATEIEMFSCRECDYRSRHKGHFKRHMLSHKNDTKIEMFNCGECGFQTKRKSNLKIHMIRHKSVIEVEIFSCGDCNYQTKLKYDLKKHMRRHKSGAEVEIFICEECGFRTKYKYSLTTHKLQHKSLTAFSYKKFLEKHNLRLESTTEEELFRTHVLQHN